jgi:hypothetical protein
VVGQEPQARQPPGKLFESQKLSFEQVPGERPFNPGARAEAAFQRKDPAATASPSQTVPLFESPVPLIKARRARCLLPVTLRGREHDILRPHHILYPDPVFTPIGRSERSVRVVSYSFDARLDRRRGVTPWARPATSARIVGTPILATTKQSFPSGVADCLCCHAQSASRVLERASPACSVW